MTLSSLDTLQIGKRFATLNSGYKQETDTGTDPKTAGPWITVDMRDVVRLVLSMSEGKKFNELYIWKDGRIYEGV